MNIEIHANVNVHSDDNGKVLHEINRKLTMILKAISTSVQDQAIVDQAVEIFNQGADDLKKAVDATTPK